MKRISRILFTVSAALLLSACFLYEDKAYNNPYDPKLTDGAYPIPYADIRIDGDTSEWGSLNTFIIDQTAEGTYSGQPEIPGGDINQFKMAQDDENLYFYLSTANGTPLVTEQISFNLNFGDENDTYNWSPVSLSHNTGGTFGWWSNYNYRIDQDNWDGYNLPDPSIRFSGLNLSDNAIEFGISKYDYWNLLSTNARLTVNMNTWYEPYYTDYNEGNLDDLWDEDHQYLVVLKEVDELIPSSDVPILQFDRPSSTLIIDGTSGDMGIWNETGYWYQDFLGDDTGSQDNCDVDKIYIKQDDEYVYVLLTFNDAADFTAMAETASYNLNLSASEGSVNFSLNANHAGFGTWSASVNGDTTNCTALSGEPGYLEIQFDKSQLWDSLPYGAFNFYLQIYDTSSTLVDEVQFIGSYKSLTDPTPS